MLLSVFGEQRKTAQTEVALAAHALDAMGDAAPPARDECRTGELRVPPSRSSYLAAIIGGGLGIVVVAVLVYSVLAVSRDAQQPVIEVKPPRATAAPASPPPAPSATPTPLVVAAAPSGTPPPDAPPPDAPAAQSAPTLQLFAPQAPLTAETMRPEPPPPSPFAEFPRLHRWFPNLFPNG